MYRQGENVNLNLSLIDEGMKEMSLKNFSGAALKWVIIKSDKEIWTCTNSFVEHVPKDNTRKVNHHYRSYD